MRIITALGALLALAVVLLPSGRTPDAAVQGASNGS
jgi:hypothetical protein